MNKEVELGECITVIKKKKQHFIVLIALYLAFVAFAMYASISKNGLEEIVPEEIIIIITLYSFIFLTPLIIALCIKYSFGQSCFIHENGYVVRRSFLGKYFTKRVVIYREFREPTFKIVSINNGQSYQLKFRLKDEKSFVTKYTFWNKKNVHKTYDYLCSHAIYRGWYSKIYGVMRDYDDWSVIQSAENNYYKYR